jgi:hypothetical protein
MVPHGITALQVSEPSFIKCRFARKCFKNQYYFNQHVALIPFGGYTWRALLFTIQENKRRRTDLFIIFIILFIYLYYFTGF